MAAVAYFFLKGVAEAQTWVFTTLPGDLGFSGEPALWPLLPLTVSRPAGRSHASLSAGNRWAQARRGVQGGRPRAPDRTAGHRARVVRHAQPGRRARPRGPADRDRQRAGGARGAPAQARRARDGGDGDRCRRQLRSRQHAPRLAAGRGISADGGVGDRRRDDGSDPDPGDARRGSGNPDLRRARQLDRLRHVLAVDPQHPAVHDPHARRVPVGDRDRAGRCRDRHRDQATGAHAAADRGAADGGADAGRRPRDRRRPRSSSASSPPTAPRRCCSPARTRCPR